MPHQSKRIDRHIVITGGTRGIGNGLAAEFLRNNCRVSISGRKQTTVDAAVKELQLISDNEACEGFVCEVTRAADIEELWNKASSIQAIDIWINNAGINHSSLQFHKLKPQAIQEVLDTNISGTMLASHTVINGMLKQGFGFLYNMEGLGSDGRIVEGVSIYGSSKRAVRYFTKALIKEYKDDPIQIGTLSPGMVVTDMLTDPLTKKPEENREALKIFHILSDRPEVVTPWLVSKILGNHNHGAHIAWLTNQKIAGRFLANMFKKRKVKGLPDF
jgi:short-subunit dehydrogenase